MSRKKPEISDLFKEEKRWNGPSEEMIGIFFLTLSAFVALSLISFADNAAENWLGLVGHFIADHLLYLLGWNGYLLLPFVAWFGWQKLFQRPIEQLAKKFFFLTLGICSLSILLNQLEILSPFLQRLFLKTVQSPKAAPSWLPRQTYHVGGVPFYNLYYTLPHYNLLRIFGQVGTFLIFFSLFTSSVLYLFKMEVAPFALRAKELIEELINRGLNWLRPFLQREEGDLFVERENRGRFWPIKRFKRIEEKTREDLQLPSLNRPNPLLTPTEFSEEVYPPLSLRQASEDWEESALREARGERGEVQQDCPAEPAFKAPRALNETLIEPMIPAPLSANEGSAARFSPRSREESASSRQSSPSAARRSEGSTRPESRQQEKENENNYQRYHLPERNLLTPPKKIDLSLLKKDLRRQAEVLEETLLSFGIEAKVGQINCGPRITSLEVHPAIGVKVQRIKTLENDIALNMQAQSIRIIAPIPGKAAVGVEIPNPYSQEVSFRELLQEYQAGKHKMHIPLLLGKAVNGENVVSDLTKMPHCIIAGATGSGKSVCINTIVMSILMLAKPDEIRLIMVDPKKVELTPYSRLPHMLAPVITEPAEAAAALNWLVKEMEKRYEILKVMGVRNIESFNNRKKRENEGEEAGMEIPERLNYIVCIIDELADLMMVSTHDIETPIARIAQMARAVGIHMILATQRPSREVITGLIKANFPTRICFKVSSRVNSQIVLDEPGSESLLGNGDMLFLPPGTSHLVRAQGAYIRDEDIQNVVETIARQAPPAYSFNSFLEQGGDDLKGGLNQDPVDALYEQAKQVVLSTGNASTTFLQRKLKIGYARAASLMDQLEHQGIVGKADGSKPRQILARSPRNLDEEELFSEDML